MNKTEEEKQEDLKFFLRQFTGGGRVYRHPLFGFVYTDGVKFLAEKAQAYWLLDLIGSYQGKKSIKQLPFQVWTLYKLQDNPRYRAAVTCREDSDKPPVVVQKIEYTDFPLDMVCSWIECS